MRNAFFMLLLLLNAAHAEERWLYLDNDHIRLGVNLSAGGCVGWLSPSHSAQNVLNAYDVGRYVQQSYYGDADGSDWNGKPWRYNPVQGGSWKNEPAEVLEVKSAETSLYTKTQSRHWATGVKTPECVMEQWARLEGGLAYLKFKMRYTGAREHKPYHQELPALFVMPHLDTLVYADVSGELQEKLPSFPNERVTIGEPWCAWVNGQTRQGLGMHLTHTKELTCYRVRHGDHADCSYLAPIQTFALKPGLVFEYEVVLALGTVEQLRAVFAKLK
jgi:hypothetical protein